MMEIIELVISFMFKIVDFLRTLIMVDFYGVPITFLGFIGAIVIISIMIRLFMPRP